MSATKQQTAIERLRERVPQHYIKQRTQGGAKLDYLEWHGAADLLDDRAPGWECAIREVGEIAGKVYVRVAITIEGVTRENIGYEDEDKSGYGDAFSNSFSMAFKRASALFGLGRHLYSKDDKRQPPQRSQAPPLRSPASSDEKCEQVARDVKPASVTSSSDTLSPQQRIAIINLGKMKNVDVEQRSHADYGVAVEALKSAQAAQLIQDLGKA